MKTKPRPRHRPPKRKREQPVPKTKTGREQPVPKLTQTEVEAFRRAFVDFVWGDSRRIVLPGIEIE